MKKYTVLVVDDSPLEMAVVKGMLIDTYEVLTASNSDDGVEIAQNEEVDIILLDLYMAGKNGFDTIEILKADSRTAKIPIIIATGSGARQDEVRALELGASDFVVKPIMSKILNLRLDMHLKISEYIKSVEQQSLTDGLTGISNRRAFDNVIKTEWQRAMRKGECLGMILIDLDFFKKFNDSHGHSGGDICLRVVATILSSSVARGNDHVFRWGGEEFAALLPDATPEGVLTVAERIRKNIESTPIQLPGGMFNVTASLGAGSVYPNQEDDDPAKMQSELFEKLDAALYLAKNNGRNRVEGVVFESL